MAARQERLLAAKDVSVRQKFADKAYNNVSLYSIHTLFFTLVYNLLNIHWLRKTHFKKIYNNYEKH